VVEVRDLTPEMRRVRFNGGGLSRFVHEPGADFVLYLPLENGDLARRHYTARAFDSAARVLDVDFLMHGDGPGTRWAAEAQAGDTVTISGPLVRRRLNPNADWYLLAGDETALPAVFGLVESLPAGASASLFLEVRDPAEQQRLASRARVSETWLYRGATPGEESSLLLDAIAAHPFPPARGEVFLAGESGRMRLLRHALLDRGLGPDQVFAMGYWRPGRFGGDETIRD
jgi:NADPH-dependent ferric siderophore reductase